jgi:peptidoglycan/xylan/chitin deacetylase (PgdA/CDA1 family)
MDHYMQMAYEWPAGKSCAVVFSADVDGESPLIWNHQGKKINAMSEVEQRRFGPRVGVYRLMNLLDEFSAKGSFYVPGFVANEYPHLLPELVERGHEVGFHGYYHERVDELSDAENAAMLDKAIEVFQQQLGFIPKGYRSPAWEMTPALFKILKQRGFDYDSSLMSFDHPYSVEGLTELPVQWLLDDAIYFRYTGGPRDLSYPASPVVVLESWIEEFEGIREYGGLFMITVHPWLSGRPQRLRMLRKLFQHIVQYDDVWWTTAKEVAEYHAGSENNAIFDIPAQLVKTEIELGSG